MHPRQHPGFCVKCGAEVGSSSRFCSLCRASLAGRQKESKFGAFGFHSRWFILVIILAFVASFISYSEYLLSVVLIAYIVFVIVSNKLSVGTLIGKIPSNYNWWPLILMALGCIAYSLGAIVVIMYPLAKLNSELVNEIFADSSLSESLASAFILLVILAPLIEEMVFRGLLFSRLTKKWNMTGAMVVSSLAFGLLHMDPIGAFVFGIVACVLYTRTRTLLVPMGLHALNNLIVWALTSTEGTKLETEIDFASPEILAQFTFEGLIAMMFGAPIVFILLGRWWPSRGTPLPYEVNTGGNTTA